MSNRALAVAPSAAQTAEIVAELRRSIAAQAPRVGSRKPPFATGLVTLDQALHGGLPRGKLVEVIGPTGKMSLTLRARASATRQGELVALVDAADALDPEAAQRQGVDLSRCLWARVKEGKDALKAADLLLGSGSGASGFGLIVLYLSALTGDGRDLARLDRMWPRLVQRCEKADTALLVVADRPLAGSFATVTLSCEDGHGIWEPVPGSRLRLCSQTTRIHVQRSRLGTPGEAELLTLRR